MATGVVGFSSLGLIFAVFREYGFFCAMDASEEQDVACWERNSSLSSTAANTAYSHIAARKNHGLIRAQSIDCVGTRLPRPENLLKLAEAACTIPTETTGELVEINAMMFTLPELISSSLEETYHLSKSQGHDRHGIATCHI
ncbi:hypothetical protein NE237_017272 [Protea cynaroides]|uniref:Uncharacterized protein n=1 Tax=Protea cynaroides TaxID=273540 RepID=A0A9Q0K7R0_9MAGN|nr:hypothetical protein NE237_017272 [Protea cynaroides]